MRVDHLPILNIFVPQTVHIPCVAGLPFFIVIFFSSFIDLFDLHLTQYASMIMQVIKRNKKEAVYKMIV
jgi:hypothetical protein